jgi:hypothetical protein
MNLFGIEYCMLWENLKIGSSVFIKTTADYWAATTYLKKVEEYFNIALDCRPRHEFGCFGLRIWRVA